MPTSSAASDSTTTATTIAATSSALTTSEATSSASTTSATTSSASTTSAATSSAATPSASTTSLGVTTAAITSVTTSVTIPGTDNTTLIMTYLTSASSASTSSLTSMSTSISSPITNHLGVSQSTTFITSTTTKLQSPPPTSTISPTSQNLPLPIENLLNIKYSATASHHWFFNNTQIYDQGSNNNFLIDSLKVRYPSDSKLQRIFTSISDVSYFVPVGQRILTNSTMDSSLFLGDSPSLLFPGDGQCIDLFNITDDHPYNQNCLSSVEQCEYGFSAALWLKYNADSITTKDTFMASGPQGTQGFEFYFQRGLLTLQITGKLSSWIGQIPMTKYINTWLIVGFSWIKSTEEMKLLIGDQFVSVPVAKTVHNQNFASTTKVYLGCLKQISGLADPQTTPKISISHIAIWMWPVRLKEILTSTLVYQLIPVNPPTTTPATTPVPPVTFDFSKFINELIGVTNDPNPYYFYSDAYYATSNIILTNEAVNVITTSRTGFQLIAKYSKINLAKPTIFLGACPCNFTACQSGLSISFWTMVPSGTTTGDIFVIVNSVRIVYANQSFAILVYNGTTIVAGQRSSSILLDTWQNIGFTLNRNMSIFKIYINGYLDKGATFVNPSDYSVQNYVNDVNISDILIGSGANDSVVGGLINDVVIWRRYLFPFESHRFVGYTSSQFKQLNLSTNYWTPDLYIQTDAPYHMSYNSNPNSTVKYSFSLSSILKPISASFQFDIDPYSKSNGQCPILTQKSTNYLFLGRSKIMRSTYVDSDINWAGICLTDPTNNNCRYNGITISMWLKIISVSFNKIQFFLSTGDLADYIGSSDGRGVSIFVNQMLFGISLSTSTKDWSIIFDSNRYTLGQWMNIGILWREDIGLQLILNGVDYGLANYNPDLRYKMSDNGKRAVLGRFDSDDINKWNSQNIWEFSNFVFGEISYYETYMTPDAYCEMLDLVNNLYYSSATWIRQGTTLINSPIQDLITASRTSQTLNYQGVIEWDNLSQSVRIISAQIPILLNASDCPASLNLCTSGFSIGGWFFITKEFRSSINGNYTLFMFGAQNTDGFGIQILNNSQILGWVQKAANYWSQTVSVSLFIGGMSEWIHIGIIWQEKTGMVIIINGNVFSTNNAVPVNSVSTTSSLLYVGDPSQNPSANSNFLVFNMVLYKSYLTAVQLPKIIGIPYNQVQLLTSSSLLWTFYGLYNKLIRHRINLVSTTYTTNKYSINNAAVCTNGADQSYIELNSTILHCLIQPDLCQSFVLIINMQVFPMALPSQTEGYILNSGTPGSTGVTIVQTSSNLTVTIRNSNRTCITNVTSYQTNQWIQLQLIWSADKGPIIKINDITVASAVNAVCISDTNTRSNLSPIVLGHHPKDLSKANKICLSEVMLINVNAGLDLDSLTKGLYQSSCYTNMDLIFPLNIDSLDQFQIPNSASTFTNAIVNYTLDNICLNNPINCNSGITISFWIFINSITGNDAVILNIGGGNNPGIQVRLQNNQGQQLDLLVSLDTGVKLWILKQVQAIPTAQWINVGIVWSDQGGLGLFLGGVTSQMVTTFLPTAVTSTVLSTTINIGKQINGIINDIVVWYSVVASCTSPRKSSQVLGGLCSPISTLPLQQKCSLIQGCVKTSGNICLDETPTNIVKMAASGMVLTAPDDGNTILGIVNRVLKNSTSNANLTYASVVLLLNVANNMIIPDSLSDSAVSTLIDAFINVNEEIMLDKYINDWKTMANQSYQNPLSVIKQTDNFYLKIARKLQSTCKPLSLVRQSLGVSLLNYNAGNTQCSSISLPNYVDSAWTSNSSNWISSSDSFTITQPVLQNNQPTLALSSSIYNASGIMPSTAIPTIPSDLIVNSRVITINTYPAFVQNPGNPIITISLKFINKNVRTGNFLPWDNIEPSQPVLNYKWSSVFWNDSLNLTYPSFGAWDKAGCQETFWNSTNVILQCDHLTSFAILMQPTVPFVNYMYALNIITYIGLGISLLCLLIFIITIAVSKSLRGTRYIIHLNMASALFIASLAFLLVGPAQFNKIFCQTTGIIMHLFFIATFNWMFFEALFVFYAVTSGVVTGRLKFFIPIGWGVPIIIIGATAGLNLDAYGRNTYCWLSLVNNYLWAFLGPVIALILMTIVICLIVACNISTPAVKGEILDEMRDNIKQTAYTIPFMLLGWIFGIIFMLTAVIPVAYMFVILCSLQGLWVLIFFGLMNPEFRYALCRKVKTVERPSSAVKILNSIETEYASEASVRVEKKVSRPPPKMTAPVYYSEAPQPKPPRHVGSVDFTQSTCGSQRNLINQSYEEEGDNIQTSTIQNNGLPQNFQRSIPGTPEYFE